MPRYQTILLDADRTLLDFDRSEHDALFRVLAARGYPADEESLSLYRRINNSLWDAMARGEYDQDFITVERFRAFQRVMGGEHDPAGMNRDYEKALGSFPYLLPGAEEFCRALHGAGLPLYVVTNGLPAAQRGRLDPTPIRPLISDVFISMEIGAQKPFPAFFDKVFAALDISDRTGSVIMGDSLSVDVLGGIWSGIDTIWYNPSGQPGKPSVVPTWEAAAYARALEIILA